MSDVRLTATNPDDSSVVPVACNARGELLTVAPVIEKIPNDVEIEGDLTVTGNLVVDGFEGPPGESVVLPPDPYEGALLGWLNGELAWVGTEPIPIPEYVFGPITRADMEQGILEVAGDIPVDILNGVYLKQCTREGVPFVPGYDFSQGWSNQCSGAISPENNAEHLFDGDLSTFCDSNSHNDGPTWSTHYPGVNKLECYMGVKGNGNEITVVSANGSETSVPADGNWSFRWVTLTLPGNSKTLKGITWKRGADGVYLTPAAIRINEKVLVDPQLELEFRVNQVMESMIIGSPGGIGEFEVGQYLMSQNQRVAPWVLYGNDPTSLIDHLRSS